MKKIDERIKETIELLNEKGYETEACCSGHTGERYVSTYILFGKQYSFDTLPENFILTENKFRIYTRTSINFKFTCLDKVTAKFLKKINNDLYEWASSLPDINKGEDESICRFKKG